MFDRRARTDASHAEVGRSTAVMTKVLDTAVSPRALDDGAQRLRRGELVAFATETVYGLGASIDRSDAVARIFAAKRRPTSDPLIVHLAEPADLDRVAAIPRDARVTVERLIARFWPGPLTLVLPRRTGVTELVGGGRDTVGVRVPGHADARALIERVGAPVAAPSANRFGRISPTTAAAVMAELDGRIDAVVDSGPCRIGIESTVVDMSRSPRTPELLRPGAVTAAEVREICPDLQSPHAERCGLDSDESPRSPGRRVRHYAPGATAVLVAPSLVDAAATACEHAGRRVLRMGGGAADDLAVGFYASLRALDVAATPSVDDATPATILIVEPDATDGIGDALVDRMWRAAEGRWVRTPNDLARIAAWLRDAP